MRILHAYFTRDFPESKRRQMDAERVAAAKEGVLWDSLVYCTNSSNRELQYMRHKSLPGRLGSLWHLFCFHLDVNAKAKRYDVILKRHNKLDFFQAIFSLFQGNIFPIHHAKEDLEIVLNDRSIRGRANAQIESVLSVISATKAKLVVGVTPEIASYHSLRSFGNKGWISFPNGYDPDMVSPLADNREGVPKLLFAASSFKAWHGLSNLLKDAVASKVDFRLFVVGIVDEITRKTYSNDSRISFVGYLEECEYRTLASSADIAIGTLRFDITGLKESCTLKNTDYLLSGLCVYAGDADCRLPEKFPYYTIGEAKIHYICAFAKKTRSISRQVVRNAALPYMDKRPHVRAFINEVGTRL